MWKEPWSFDPRETGTDETLQPWSWNVLSLQIPLSASAGLRWLSIACNHKHPDSYNLSAWRQFIEILINSSLKMLYYSPSLSESLLNHCPTQLLKELKNYIYTFNCLNSRNIVTPTTKRNCLIRTCQICAIQSNHPKLMYLMQ